MESWERARENLPERVTLAFGRAKERYRQGDFSGAEAHDRVVLAYGEETGDTLCRVQGHRYVGLCLYRQNRFEDSRVQLNQALELAVDKGLTLHAAFVCNHLGATERQLGRIERALGVFGEGLNIARVNKHLEARARLLGNLGALYDSIGQRSRSDDCYARYEELLELLDDPERLANARGLAGRAAMLRGDLDGAWWRFRDQAELAERYDLPKRRMGALYHQGQERAARATLERHAGRDVTALENEARRAFDEAIEQAVRMERWVRLPTFLRARAAFHRQSGRWLLAYRDLVQAVQVIDRLEDQPARKAKAYRDLALLCQDLGLHGEAFHHLGRSVEKQIEIAERLQSVWAKELLAPMQSELLGLAGQLRSEAGLVHRSARERERLEDLVGRLRETLPQTSSPESSKLAFPDRLEDAHHWAEGIRAQAESLWSQRILGAHFAQLHADTRDDLVRSEIAYHGAVGDIGRSAHLLLLCAERELRQRFYLPLFGLLDRERDRRVARGSESELLQVLSQRGTKVSLGFQLQLLGHVLSNGEVASGGFMERARRRFAAHGDALRPLLRLGQPVQVLGEAGPRPHDFVSIRNAVAHGDHRIGTIDRLVVDAVKRTLALDEPGLVQGLVGVS